MNVSTFSTREDPEDDAALIAEDLYKLSITERERVLFDLHGVSVAFEETPEMIACRLAELEMKISMIKKKPAYATAKAKNPEYVGNRNLRLKFLRAESFDSQRAADRLVRFFESKLELFGEDKLAKDITSKDLDQEDRAHLEKGQMQVLPLRDRAGRVVVTWNAIKRGQSSLKNRHRLIFYTTMAVAEDEDAQKQGMVLVHFLLGLPPDLFKLIASATYASSIPPLFAVLPMRVVAAHLCIDSVELKRHQSTLIRAAETASRVRFRVHFGAMEECQSELMTFGIPVQVFPPNTAEAVDLDQHKKWIEQRQVLEAASSAEDVRTGFEALVIPRAVDVLYGRDAKAQQHPGNIRYHVLIETNQNRYDATDSRIEKTAIAYQIVQTIKEHGGCFLKQDQAGWVVVDDTTARNKVTNAFRSRRKAINDREKLRGNSDGSKSDVPLDPMSIGGSEDGSFAAHPKNRQECVVGRKRERSHIDSPKQGSVSVGSSDEESP